MVKNLILSLMKNKRELIDKIFDECPACHRAMLFGGSLERARCLLAFVPFKLLVHQYFFICLSDEMKEEIYNCEESCFE